MINKKQKNNIVFTLGLIFIVSLTLFVIGQVYSNALPKIVEELNNSAIGAILTAIITVFLLTQQSKSEEIKEKKAKVFEEKIAIFNRFLDKLKDIINDNQISVDEDNDELKELIFQLSFVKMHSSAQNTQKLIDHLLALDKLLITPKTGSFDYQKFSDVLFSIVDVFQNELYEENFGNVKIDISGLAKKIITLDEVGEKEYSSLSEFLEKVQSCSQIILKDYTQEVLEKIDKYIDSLNNSKISKKFTITTTKAKLKKSLTITPKVVYLLNNNEKSSEIFNIDIDDWGLNCNFAPGLENYMLSKKVKSKKAYFENISIEAAYLFNDDVKNTIVKSIEFLETMMK